MITNFILPQIKDPLEINKDKIVFISYNNFMWDKLERKVSVSSSDGLCAGGRYAFYNPSFYLVNNLNNRRAVIEEIINSIATVISHDKNNFDDWYRINRFSSYWRLAIIKESI